MRTISFFSIKTQFENLGDALINRELIRIAAENSQVVADLSRCEPSFASSLRRGCPGAEFINGFGDLLLRIIVARLRGYRCYYYLSPGGYFGKILFRELPSRVANTAMVILMWLAGVKIILAAISAERLSPGSVRLFRIRRKFIYRLLVRDTLSEDYLKSVGIKVDGVIPDLAFNLFRDVDRANKRSEGSSSSIAISFRADQDKHAAERITKFLRHLTRFSPSQARLLCYSQVKRDRDFMRQLAVDAAATGISAGFEEEYEDIDRAASVLSQCDLVISNRLHVLLIGAATGAKIVPVVDGTLNQKIRGLFGDLGVSVVSLDSWPQDLPVGATLIERGRELKLKLQEDFKDVYATTDATQGNGGHPGSRA